MTETVYDYTPPVADLLTLGDIRQVGEQYDYLAHGFTAAHLAELQRMALDEELHWEESELPLVWAPIHAWRVIALLREPGAVPTMIQVLHQMEEWDDDWTISEAPKVFGQLGVPAIELLQQFLANRRHYLFARVAAAEGLAKMVDHYPEARAQIVTILTEQLRAFAKEEDEFNAFLIGVMVDIKAVEAAEVMAQAFAADKVDWTVQGDWEDVQIQLGLLTERITPPPDLWSWGSLEPSDEEPMQPRDLFALNQPRLDAQRTKRKKAKKMAKQTKQKQRSPKKKKRK